jgi:proteic killer suppression protein
MVTVENMIKSFKHKGLEVFFYTGKKKGIRPEQANRLERILDRLNAATDVKDMNYPGSNLHQLKGDKKGQYAVSVSGNWRIFFEFIDGDAYIVDYDDYH